jgi:hypothetical protein
MTTTALLLSCHRRIARWANGPKHASNMQVSISLAVVIDIHKTTIPVLGWNTLILTDPVPSQSPTIEFITSRAAPSAERRDPRESNQELPTVKSIDTKSVQ